MLPDTLKKTLKDHFGKPQRVVLAVWVLSRRDEPFYLAEAANGVRPLVSDSNLTYELESFVRYGMLQIYQDGRRNYYTVLDHPLWGAFDAIGHATDLHALLQSSSERLQ